MKRIIDTQINEVNDKVIELWDRCLEAYDQAKLALSNKDLVVAMNISKNDIILNELEEDINELTIKIITLQAPVASDLRFLIASIKIANQLERIADYTVNIADTVLLDKQYNQHYLIEDEIIAMIDQVKQMLEVSKEAFMKQDTKKAKQAMALDQLVDALYDQSIKKMVELKEADERNIRVTLIAKYLERSGDHVTNIGEIIYYMIRGRNFDGHDALKIIDGTNN